MTTTSWRTALLAAGALMITALVASGSGLGDSRASAPPVTTPPSSQQVLSEQNRVPLP